MSQMSYTEGFKKQAVEKIFSSKGHVSCSNLADELDVPYSTLMKWKRDYSRSFMSKEKKEFTAEEKLESILKKESLSETEFGEFLRSKGVLASDVESWRHEVLKGFNVAVKSPGRPKKDPELHKLQKEVKTLKKDLNRKDRALAEMSARVILIKKSQKLFGMMDSEDEE